MHSPQSRQRFGLAGAGLSGIVLLIAAPLLAQGPPPAVIRYTVAREHNVRRELVLPGTAEPRTATTLASTMEGQVIDFPAKEGMRFSRGQVLARLDTGTLQLRLDVQRSTLKEAEARLKLAESNLARAKELFAATVVSKQQLDDSQSEFNAWLGRVDSLKGEIARTEDEIARCTIRSPLAGVVVRERTEVGQWMTKGGPVVELLDLETVEIRVEVPERYFASLRVGSTATATFESLTGFTARGKVLAIIPEADRQARTFPVKVVVPNERGRIAVGMLARVSFEAGDLQKATLVPKDAVISRGDRKVLYRMNGNNTVEELAVETGIGVGAWIEVRGPVRAGDKVVTRGNERLRPGQPVQATPIEYERP
jgi:RND family efflux transporter MFP subunit